MSRTRNRWLWAAICYVPFLVLCGFIFWLSSLSNPFIFNIFKIRHFDKILHLVAFGVIGASAALGASIRKRSFGLSVFLEAWILTCFYGFLDEIHQRFTPHRSSHLADFFADVMGATIGILCFFALANLFIKTRQSLSDRLP